MFVFFVWLISWNRILDWGCTQTKDESTRSNTWILFEDHDKIWSFVFQKPQSVWFPPIAERDGRQNLIFALCWIQFCKIQSKSCVATEIQSQQSVACSFLLHPSSSSSFLRRNSHAIPVFYMEKNIFSNIRAMEWEERECEEETTRSDQCASSSGISWINIWVERGSVWSPQSSVNTRAVQSSAPTTRWYSSTNKYPTTSCSTLWKNKVSQFFDSFQLTFGDFVRRDLFVQ